MRRRSLGRPGRKHVPLGKIDPKSSTHPSPRGLVVPSGFSSETLHHSGGLPPLYDLDFWSTSYLGVPFYQFASNWGQNGGVLNFESTNGGAANVGDRVVTWKNMWLSPGEGDAVVNPNAFFAINKPFLREKTYGSKTYQGLEFTGTEYLQINGSTVSDAYSVPAPLFSTGGVPWNGNTGATFMFVIDSSEEVDGGTYTSPVQSLIYSRQPIPSPPGFGVPPIIIPVPWPNTEDLGIQYLRNKDPHIGNGIISTELAVGPQGTFQGQIYPDGATALTRSPYGGYGGAEYTFGDAGLEYGGGLNFKARYANSGFQVILLEYDNINQAKHLDLPNMGADRDYGGPQVKIYGMSNPNNPPADFTGTWSLPWNGLDLTIPKITFTNPMLRDHILFDKAHLFLGGVPAIHLDSPGLNDNQKGNGFRGIIYEVMMLDGVLSKKDKERLSKQLLTKYGSALT